MLVSALASFTGNLLRMFWFMNVILIYSINPDSISSLTTRKESKFWSSRENSCRTNNFFSTCIVLL
ncbi:uncharacterized protein Smp_202710 [Schistosoma mansoni]|uniref:uncharacterized protein n=1 Tax=Schistosoma mansoni TaxID=6183 RepID=UPI00022DC591|nr:uncharacterized protein Smp_202710 [Schistosoma mansoni]|eukprot:XP_018652171.1 uncharacterized protein Smp_202710 [Schistosoma mansoni]